jgi:hypothetical protein
MMPLRGGEMSDRKDTPDNPDGADDRREPYEAPRLTNVGNARDLLAGNVGSVNDACLCACPNLDTQPSG